MLPKTDLFPWNICGWDYVKNEFNNFYRNDELWNYTLTKTILQNSSNQKAKNLSANYLPMLVMLRKVYEESGETKKRDEIESLINRIALQSKKSDQVQKLKTNN